MLRKNVDLYNLKLELLEASNIQEWEYYYEIIDAYVDMFGEEALEDSKALISILMDQGLKDWSGYKEALKYYWSYLVYLKKHKPTEGVLSYKAYIKQYNPLPKY